MTDIIVQTANAMKGDKEKYLDAGFDAYIAKKFDIHEFGEIIARFL